jgi:hypothetical protein
MEFQHFWLCSCNDQLVQHVFKQKNQDLVKNLKSPDYMLQILHIIPFKELLERKYGALNQHLFIRLLLPNTKALAS